jgi:signal transduction histidine kinase
MNVVMVKFAERDLLKSRLEAGNLLMRILEEKLEEQISEKKYRWEDINDKERFSKELDQLVTVSGFSHYMVVNRTNTVIYKSKTSSRDQGRALVSARNVMTTGKTEFDFFDTGWGVIWLAPKKLHMSSPIKTGKTVFGAITIESNLSPIYQVLRESEKTALIYIALNTIVLVFFGIYLLSRSVVKPIHKLIGITEKFETGETFPSLGDSIGNEIGQLSHSLNLMLTRLEENKKDMREHILTLEKANLELKKAQREIIQSEKLASVGRLATGVAHEIGNPIGIILGYIELLRGAGLSQDEKTDFLDRIESEITRVSQIIKQLLDFSRPTSGRPEYTSVHEVLRETVEMLRPQPMMAHMEIVEDLKSPADKIFVDPDQLKQVFLNIVLNASDAMKENAGGANGHLKNILTISSEKINDHLRISLEDSGPGISGDILPHIFDPFFTTKEPGMGTGLGLSVSYRIIESLGGSIRAESVADKGSTIIIDIPLTGVKNKN